MRPFMGRVGSTMASSAAETCCLVADIGAEGPTARNCTVRGQSFLVIGEAARILCIRKMNEAALLRAVIACNGNGRNITAPGRRVVRNKPGSNLGDDIACKTDDRRK